MAFLNTILSFLGISEAITQGVQAPSGMWHILILKTFEFVADYGWRIVVFTVLLKLVISPLDFYQRYKMNKNQKITERLKPTMEKIQKQYAGDKQAFQQKQMELNRKEGYSYFSACLPMIITLVVFITLWMSMQTIARYMMFKEYTTLYDEYTYVTEQIYEVPPEIIEIGNKSEEEKTDEERKMFDEAMRKWEITQKIGQDVVYQMYYNGIDESYVQTLRDHTVTVTDEAGNESAVKDYADMLPDDLKLLRGDAAVEPVQSSFLWIKNIWAPDVPWGNQAVLSKSAFLSGIGDYQKSETSGLDGGVQTRLIDKYDEVMYRLLNDAQTSRTNGYLILPILVVLLSVGAQLLSMFQQKRAGQVNAQGGVATSMKVMMFVMPVMMAVFALQSASIFALYMAVNSATTLLFNLLFTGIIRLIDKLRANKSHAIYAGSPRGGAGLASPDIIHYVKGANPNAGARPVVTDEPTGKKSKKDRSSATVVRRGGRPDPNELMGYDMSANKSDKQKRK
ncbi:MAG: membrane protein insertase YidC [Clostridia bacterium]|nr:membrane protein insertase YidC [Clostridia bacterium]